MIRKFWFGKYKGQNIIDICVTDHTYITWCLRNVMGFSLNKEEEAKYILSKPYERNIGHNERSVWEDFDEEMTYGMMMNLD